MISPKQIPFSALKAAQDALAEHVGGHASIKATRAAIAAALNAWPDAFITKYSEGAPAFNLPLPQDNTDGR